MPRLAPFRALRYTSAAGPLSAVLAPPYDVIDAGEADELRSRSPHNAVRLVLPEGEAPGRYREAARRLDAWWREGVLARDEEPSVTVYRQTYEWKGRAVERLTLFAALELTAFERGEVLPHERTHRGPKEDRLALTLACRAQLSPVFVVAGDPEGGLVRALRTLARGAPTAEGETPDGIGHDLWRVRDPAAVARLCELAGATPLLIADGHHRYETALAARAARPDEPGAALALVCIASEADRGLAVLPTHRALAAVPPGTSWEEALADAFELERLEERDPARLASAADDGGGPTIVARTPEVALLLRARPGLAKEAGVPAAQAGVATAIFDRLVLGRLLGTTAEAAAEAGRLSYHREPDAAIRAAGPTGAAFLVPPLPVPAIRAAVAGDERLPPKTTYFAPKIPTGLVFRPW